MHLDGRLENTDFAHKLVLMLLQHSGLTSKIHSQLFTRTLHCFSFNLFDKPCFILLTAIHSPWDRKWKVATWKLITLGRKGGRRGLLGFDEASLLIKQDAWLNCCSQSVPICHYPLCTLKICSWVSYLTSLGLSFPVCKMRIAVRPLLTTGQQGIIRSGSRCKALSPACGKRESDCVLPISGFL